MATEEILLGLCDFLQPYLPLVNSHNVDYLTHDHWHHYMPSWFAENELVDLYELFEQRYQQSSLSVNNELEIFIDQLVDWKKRIERIVWTRERFDEHILNQRERKKPKGYKYANRTFMTEKKEHEVDILSPLIDQVACLSSADAIIDYGCGRGYLGVQISHDFDRHVLGIELSAATVHSGERRHELMLKYQKEFSVGGDDDDQQHYRTTSTLVTRETNFENLFYQIFQHPSSSFLLCGLHSCGSLSASLLHHYVEKSSVRAIVNVSCCYHLLDEKFLPNPFNDQEPCETDPCSFPLTPSLIERKMKLGRNARMLAVQSFERNKTDRTSNAGLWYRALIQVILTDIYQMETKVEDIKLGKLTKKCPNFETYVWKALDKLQMDKSKITTTMIEEYWRRYESQQCRLHMFIQFKVLFAGLIEMLVLLDRLVFLQHSLPSAHSYLVDLFDPILSPRRWCLISMK